ncbi:uncharacterized protein L969DRAFT_14195 [Mixia osmundae IAM 14324]|uniref:COP9 signalosome complex subunit 5 n=1 Tax=Mixia osmundae (strain CBS 9802 / IAM 14324 / JCM 22182 / KY 12970) TaxID=764103 RepID=G7E3Y4_MIXOS|nr:uncharacterized protein L969DRAFT_14195 [Mixia osmundae IAM 14324]KEI41990.1 hypothetical protein L969DRAFT_14195 [Mixia osmundae IAM 14324]GAA97544.1 hypothetical protein E5Q_04222 [Mixia osmundae IAM 14324]
MSASNGGQDARLNFEMANKVEALEADKIYRYDADEQKRIGAARPWKQDPHYFRDVRISSVALIKMVMHARSGGVHEIMGMMQGKIDGNTFVVMDAFALPVEGTETRINASNDANEYIVEYTEKSKLVGRLENIVGWYHSHPGYGCWLSGIDVMTQHTNQTFTDPFLAIVIDPNRTISAGRVDIGAFRTYPEGYTPPDSSSMYQSVPLENVEDFGAHASRYYPLNISHFKSSLDTKLLDLLWNKYWAMTLSQSSLVSNRAYMTSQLADLSRKLSDTRRFISGKAEVATLLPELMQGIAANNKASDKGKEAESSPTPTAGNKTALQNVVQDSHKLACECSHGQMTQVIKDLLYNGSRGLSDPKDLESLHVHMLGH